MITRVHKCARTTPRLRAEIAAGNDAIATLAKHYGLSPMTGLEWKCRYRLRGPSPDGAPAANHPHAGAVSRPRFFWTQVG